MLKLNKFVWLGILGFVLPVAGFAEDAAHAAGPAGSLGAAAVAIGIALAVFGAALAQGKIASAYMEGASRNPGADSVMKTPLILSLIFVETLVLFTVLIELMLVGKV